MTDTEAVAVGVAAVTSLAGAWLGGYLSRRSAVESAELQHRFAVDLDERQRDRDQDERRREIAGMCRLVAIELNIASSSIKSVKSGTSRMSHFLDPITDECWQAYRLHLASELPHEATNQVATSWMLVHELRRLAKLLGDGRPLTGSMLEIADDALTWIGAAEQSLRAQFDDRGPGFGGEGTNTAPEVP